MRDINRLVKQLSTTAVRGDHPLGFYVREVTYSRWDSESRCITSQQLVAILRACDQLYVINIAPPFNIPDLPDILRTKRRIQYLCFKRHELHAGERYSFWSLFNTLTTTSPDIKSVKLFGDWTKVKQGHPDATTISHVARAHSPCSRLERVWITGQVWTTPYLRYLTCMAPNLVDVQLGLASGENLTELKSALETSLRDWSRTLKELYIYYSHNVPSYIQLELLPLALPRMERLEKLRLVRVPISRSSLYNLSSLESLELEFIDREDIVATLSRRPVVERLAELVVDSDKLRFYREITAGRNLSSMNTTTSRNRRMLNPY